MLHFSLKITVRLLILFCIKLYVANIVDPVIQEYNSANSSFHDNLNLIYIVISAIIIFEFRYIVFLFTLLIQSSTKSKVVFYATLPILYLSINAAIQYGFNYKSAITSYDLAWMEHELDTQLLILHSLVAFSISLISFEFIFLSTNKKTKSEVKSPISIEFWTYPVIFMTATIIKSIMELTHFEMFEFFSWFTWEINALCYLTITSLFIDLLFFQKNVSINEKIMAVLNFILISSIIFLMSLGISQYTEYYNSIEETDFDYHMSYRMFSVDCVLVFLFSCILIFSLKKLFIKLFRTKNGGV